MPFLLFLLFLISLESCDVGVVDVESQGWQHCWANGGGQLPFHSYGRMHLELSHRFPNVPTGWQGAVYD